MLRGFFGNLIFAIIARMLCGNHLKLKHHCYLPIRLQNFLRYCGSTVGSVSYIARLGSGERHASRETRRTRDTREAPKLSVLAECPDSFDSRMYFAHSYASQRNYRPLAVQTRGAPLTSCFLCARVFLPTLVSRRN